jgi:hypothetical protein
MQLITDKQLSSLNEAEREFYAILEQIPVRKERKRKCDEPLDLEDGECRALLSIGRTETTEGACLILKPIYSKYRELAEREHKGKSVMPMLIVRCLHFVIYRDCVFKVANQEKSLSSRCSYDVFGTLKSLNVDSKTVLDKMGIQPVRDFCFETYEAVKSDFFVDVIHRDKLHLEILKLILFYSDYATFIDAKGEHTILSEFYFGKNEVACSDDCMAVNFYHALVFKRDELLQRVTSELNSEVSSDGIESYRENLNTKRDDKIYKRQYNDWIADDKPSVPTYPFHRKDVKIREAFQYLFVLLHDIKFDFCRPDASDLIVGYLNRLYSRLKDVRFCWVSPKDLFKVIVNPKASIESPDNPDGNEFNFYSKKATKPNEKGQKIADRSKKGLLFYDSLLDNGDRNENVAAFSRFVKDSDCLWIFVCKREEEGFIKMLEGANVNIVYLNKMLPRVYTYKTDTVIITNAITDLFMRSVTTTDNSDFIPAIVTDRIKKLPDYGFSHKALVFVKPNKENSIDN